MKNSRLRMRDIFKDVLPPTGSEKYRETIERLSEQEKKYPQIQKIVRENFKKAQRSFEAQYQSHCGLLTELSLRHYLKEFNIRAWEHGLRSMPTMFNIMEAFFRYRKPEMYFELIEEELYKLSYYDFVNFVTSNHITDKPKLIKENLPEDLISHFKFDQDLKNIRYSTPKGDKLLIAGASLIRRGHEATVLLIAGRKVSPGAMPFLGDFSFDKEDPEKGKLLKSFYESIEGKEEDYEFIDTEKQFAKVLIVCRIDLDSETTAARYIANEYNFRFDVITDEVIGYLNPNGTFKSDSFKKVWENSFAELENYNSIFESAKAALLLPYYLNKSEEKIIEETLETNFGKEYKSPLKKREFRNILGTAVSFKPIFILDKLGDKLPDIITVREDLFRIETSGYWKNIAIDEIGIDKNGKPMRGKTWVNKTLSYYQANEDELIVENEEHAYTGPNAGYIYILRNPSIGNDVFKIGLTRYNVDERAKQLSRTSVPDKFYKCQEWNTIDCITAEKQIHEQLSGYRVDPRREFFRVNYEMAVRIVSEVVAKINKRNEN